MAVNTHEINLSIDKFNSFTSVNYIILQVNDIEVNDFILFKQIAGTDPGEETGLFQMTQVQQIIQDEGLKEGYALLLVSKL